MTRFATILLGLTFVISVAALVLALWPVVADAPWEDGVTEPELREIIQTEHEASSKASKEEKKAERVAKCESTLAMGTYFLDTGKQFGPEAANEMLRSMLENRCFSSP